MRTPRIFGTKTHKPIDPTSKPPESHTPNKKLRKATEELGAKAKAYNFQPQPQPTQPEKSAAVLAGQAAAKNASR